MSCAQPPDVPSVPGVASSERSARGVSPPPALDTTRLHAEALERAREVEILLDATAALNAAETEDAVTYAAAERAARLIGVAFASVGLVQDDHLLMISVHFGDTWEQAQYRPPASGSIISDVLATGRPYRSDTLAADPRSDHAADARFGFRSQLCVPLLSADGRALGVLSLYNKRDDAPFTARDEAMLTALATQAAVALERARSRAALARTLEALAHSEQRFRSLVQHGSDLIVVVDAGYVARYVSSSAERILGFRPDDLVGTDVRAWVHPDDRVQGRGRRMDEPSFVPHAPEEFRVRHADGSWRFLEAVATNLLDEPSVRGVVINARDVTERKLLEEQLLHQAFHDSLTALPNRALFMDRLGHALAGADRRGSGVAVLFVDLDGFKVVNDSLGHAAGDELLTVAGRRLASWLRPGDTVARFGGDEFAVLLEDVSRPGDALRAAERMIDALRGPVVLNGHEMVIGASIGIAISAAGAGEARPDDLMREADIALYQAKSAGKARAAVFHPSMNAGPRQRLELEADLRRAVARGELLVYFQPEVDLVSGTIAGMEALVRWQHPQRGLLAPADFIPLAEDTGLIVPLGRWVLGEASRQAQAWRVRHPHHADLVLSVNLSARQFQQPDLVAQVQAVLRDTGLPPRCLRLEITESVLMDDVPLTETTLRALQALGVGLAIDDFGKGYSSLSYLRRFPVHTLKVDRSFVTLLDHDQGTVAIVRAVTALGHALGLDITAEGIETAAHLAAVRAVGCDRAQGYYLARPLAPPAMEALLAAGSVPCVGAGAEVA